MNILHQIIISQKATVPSASISKSTNPYRTTIRMDEKNSLSILQSATEFISRLDLTRKTFTFCQGLAMQPKARATKMSRDTT